MAILLNLVKKLPPALKRALSGVRVMTIVTVGDNDVIGVMAV